MKRLVIDADVVVAALLSSTGASRQVFIDTIDQRWRGLVSVPLLLEYESVLKRKKHGVSAGVTAKDIDIVMDEVASSLEHAAIYYLWRPFLRDGKDDMVLETAVNGEADYIVTFNVRDFTGVHDKFGIEIIRPVELLRRNRT